MAIKKFFFINRRTLWRTVWRFLKKLKIELPYDPAIPLLGIYPEKTVIQKDTCRGFPGGAVVKGPPANAGDTGSSPGPGRSHIKKLKKKKKTHAPECSLQHYLQ